MRKFLVSIVELFYFLFTLSFALATPDFIQNFKNTEKGFWMFLASLIFLLSSVMLKNTKENVLYLLPTSSHTFDSELKSQFSNGKCIVVTILILLGFLSFMYGISQLGT